MPSTQSHGSHPERIYDINLPKVFVIGHNKTATRSIHQLFQSSGYRAVHWGHDKLAFIIASNLKSNLPLLTYIDNYHCYSDMEIAGEFYAYELFPLFDLQYPGSLFIYNSRNIDDWIKSRLNHKILNHEDYGDIYKERFNSRNNKKLTSIKEVEQHWRRFYGAHEKRVLEYFKNKSNLIQLNIDSIQSQQDLVIRLSEEGFKIKDSLKTLPVIGVSKTNS